MWSSSSKLDQVFLTGICIFIFVGINSACSPMNLGDSSVAPENSIETSPTIKPEVLPSPLPSTPTQAANPQELSLTQYNILAELNYTLHQVAVQETITYTNKSQVNLNEIVLMVEPNRYNGTFNLKDLLVAGKSPTHSPLLDSNQMRLTLDRPLQPERVLVLSLAYQLNLPEPIPSSTTRPVPFGWTDRQTNLVDWYPFIPPYEEGKGWLAHRPGYFGEHLAYETANFDITIRNTGKEIFRAPSSLADSGETQPGQLTVAASAPAQQSDQELHYSLSNARTFSWSVSPYYVVQAQTVGNVLVLGYTFPIHVQGGEAALKTTAQSLELFQKMFSPYPFKTLSVVEADFLDGMEYDGLYFLSDGFYNLYQGNPAEYLVAIAAHETSHQWWFSMVGNDQAEDPWLDESFATYSEKLFYEYTYPEAQDWWWTYRVDFFKPAGFINQSIYSFSETPSPYESYRNAVYLNGAKFLEDLRKTLGDEEFFNFLRTYIHTYQDQIATTQGFLDLLRNNTKINLGNLLNQYFLSQ